MNTDRTVHGRGHDEDDVPYQVVRYDRAGKWYLEYRDDAKPRKAVTLAQAVAATDAPFLRRPGGQQFDARYRKAHQS